MAREAERRRSDLESRVLALRDAGNLDDAVAAALEGSRSDVERFLGSMLGLDDSRDAFSLFAEGVWKGLSRFRGECSLRTWLLRIAAHAAAHIRRDPYRRRAEPLPSTSGREVGVASMSRLFPSGRHEALQVLLQELEAEDLTLLELRVHWELEWDDVALLLSSQRPVGAPALRKRYERLLKRLEQRARELGMID